MALRENMHILFFVLYFLHLCVVSQGLSEDGNITDGAAQFLAQGVPEPCESILVTDLDAYKGITIQSIVCLKCSNMWNL